MSEDTYRCGHPRTDANTKRKRSGRLRKDGTRGITKRCRICYNTARLIAWHRNNPRKPKPPATWEAEIRIRRNGRLQRHENGLGPSALHAYRNATTDLLRELETEDGGGYE